MPFSVVELPFPTYYKLKISPGPTGIQIRFYRRGFALGNISQAFFFEKEQILHSTLQSRFLALLSVSAEPPHFEVHSVRAPSNLIYIFMIFLLSETILYYSLLVFIEIK